MKQQAVKKGRQVRAMEPGVNLDVLGRALIAQADERIKWHKQTAAVMAAELKAMTSAAPDASDGWRQRSRRTDLESKISGHLEYARFLTFVRQNIVRTKRYRLGLTDMSLLEITPKDYYC
jgi:hypothetical protein